jgi:hypothetical protein
MELNCGSSSAVVIPLCYHDISLLLFVHDVMLVSLGVLRAHTMYVAGSVGVLVPQALYFVIDYLLGVMFLYLLIAVCSVRVCLTW